MSASPQVIDKPRDKPRDKPHDMMGGFAKGLAVIAAFDADHVALTIADVARLTGLDRATSRRCLLTLVHGGYARADGKQFSLTPRILRLGYAYLAASPLPRLVQPYLESLSEATQESCSVSILDGGEIVYVARASQRRVMSIGLGVGSRLPAYCASMGRVLLAALPETEAHAILEGTDRKSLTNNTKTDLDALMAELATIRENGYAIVDEELEIGLRSIAIPLRSRSGQIAGALNIGAQVSRVSIPQLRDTMLPAMLAVQQELMGYL